MAIEGLKYMIIRPERAGIGDLWRFLTRGDVGSEANKFIEFSSCGDDDVSEREDDPFIGCKMFEAKEKRWVIFVSVIIRKLLGMVDKPMEWTGYFVDFFLNLLYLNGNLIGLFFNFVQGKVVIPHRGSANFFSLIGHLDERLELYKSEKSGERASNGVEMENRCLMDLSIMASKLAYENENVVKEVVINHWKMHFVGFYNCWNDYQKEMATQVFILCDKPTDANLILVSFRGTEPFDACDWSTDFDYSWYEIPNIGKIHMGFIEALGLGSRTDTASFQHNLNNKDIKLPNKTASPNMGELSAYETVRRKAKELLAEHRNAKFVVTGHSLGGALAILFPTVLVLHEEREVMEKLLAVYTFGQPRVGDSKLGKFMEAELNESEARYFRVVYCNDVVPRLPYDDNTFLYKHFGVCLYYNGFYTQEKVEEEPNRNYFSLRYMVPEHANAVWELIRAFVMPYIYGKDYEESWCSISFRLIGLSVPGISAHSPRDYVNSVRLGREAKVQMSSIA